MVENDSDLDSLGLIADYDEHLIIHLCSCTGQKQVMTPSTITQRICRLFGPIVTRSLL